MNRIPSRIVTLLGGLALAFATAHADTLVAPAEIMALPDGSFSYDVVFTKGPGGSGVLGGYTWYGEENVLGGIAADCFCAPHCPEFDPGETFTIHVSGQLSDPDASGRVIHHFSLCDVPTLGATTIVRNFSVAGVLTPATTAVRLWNAPNPFAARTTFHYDLPAEGPVSLVVYDLAGRIVARVAEGVQSAGPHAVSWDAPASRIPGGVLFARLAFAGRVSTRTVIVAR